LVVGYAGYEETMDDAERALALKTLIEKFNDVIMLNKNMNINTAIGNCFGNQSVPYMRHASMIMMFQNKILN